MKHCRSNLPTIEHQLAEIGDDGETRLTIRFRVPARYTHRFVERLERFLTSEFLKSAPPYEPKEFL